MLSQVLAGYFATHTQRLLGVIRDRFGQHDVAAQSCNAPRLVGSMIAGREGQDPRDHLVGAAPPLIIYAFLMDYYIAGLTAGATKG